LMRADGSSVALPPPVPPPFAPKTGPSDGSRKAAMARTPRFASPCTRPIDDVVLPSPYFVGVMAVTSTSLPRGLFARSSVTVSHDSLARGPWRRRSSGSRSSFSATRVMGSMAAEDAAIAPGGDEETRGRARGVASGFCSTHPATRRTAPARSRCGSTLPPGRPPG
jgi:hypothetical protein